MTALAPTLQAFFTDRLIRQRQASPHTIAAYRDTLRLLLGFAAAHRQAALALDLADLDAAADRRRSSTTSNTTAATASAPATPAWPRSTRCSATPRCATPSTPPVDPRVLAIPAKRFDRSLVTYLTEPEVDALLAAPTGHLDRAPRPRPAALAVQTGLASPNSPASPAPTSTSAPARTSLPRQGPQGPRHPAHQPDRRRLRVWLAEHAGDPTDPLFPTRTGTPLSRDAIERRLAKHAHRHGRPLPKLRGKKSHRHVLRHTTAMRLLHAGVDITVIALWLGHEQHRDHPDLPHTPTSPKEKHWPEPGHRTASPAETSRPTASSPGSKGSDYVTLQVETSGCPHWTWTDIGIIRRSA